MAGFLAGDADGPQTAAALGDDGDALGRLTPEDMRFERRYTLQASLTQAALHALELRSGFAHLDDSRHGAPQSFTMHSTLVVSTL